MTEFKIQQLDNTFRIKKMNAIDVLAFRTQIDFDDFSKAKHTYDIILENIEVKLNNDWLPVKAGKDEYYPAGIEENIEAVAQLIRYFMDEFLKPVFTKSNA